VRRTPLSTGEPRMKSELSLLTRYFKTGRFPDSLSFGYVQPKVSDVLD